jgi:hypothetical protein
MFPTYLAVMPLKAYKLFDWRDHLYLILVTNMHLVPKGQYLGTKQEIYSTKRLKVHLFLYIWLSPILPKS